MTMSILSMANGESNSYYYSPEIRLLLESHLEYFKNHSTTTSFQVTPYLAYKYEGDFYGLLTSQNIPLCYQWLIMRMNDYASPTEMSADRMYFLQPQFQLVEQVINMQRAAKSIPN